MNVGAEFGCTWTLIRPVRCLDATARVRVWTKSWPPRQKDIAMQPRCSDDSGCHQVKRRRLIAWIDALKHILAILAAVIAYLLRRD